MNSTQLATITDTDVLRGIVLEQLAAIAERDQSIARRDHTIAWKSAEIARLTAEIARLRRVQFAAHSEKRSICTPRVASRFASFRWSKATAPPTTCCMSMAAPAA